MKLGIFILNFLLILPLCSSCSDDKTDEYWGVSETYDIPVTDIAGRDPFILVDRASSMYYMYYHHNMKIKVLKSPNLKMWKDMGYAYSHSGDFWGTKDFWAPDVYIYDGKYYMFTTFSGVGYKRGTSVLVSNKPEGPFVPLVNAPATPLDWMCLDGALYVDEDNTPWMLFCREWLDVKDGQICLVELSKDLKKMVSEPVVLFSASEAEWTGSRDPNVGIYVTDAPFVTKLVTGELVMTWSSFRKDNKYSIGQVVSKNGKINGPWEHHPDAINNDDGGHAMIFRDLNGQIMISYHAPNSWPERPKILPISVKEGIIQKIN